jgi:hypothetical protein
LRVPSRVEVATAAAPEPPAAMMATSANCEAPEKSKADRAIVCQTLRPAATERAPKLTAYVPVATPTDNDWSRTCLRRRRARRGGCEGMDEISLV